MHFSVEYDCNNVAQVSQEDKTVNSYSVNNADTHFHSFLLTVPTPVLSVAQNYWPFFFLNHFREDEFPILHRSRFIILSDLTTHVFRQSAQYVLSSCAVF